MFTTDNMMTDPNLSDATRYVELYDVDSRNDNVGLVLLWNFYYIYTGHFKVIKLLRGLLYVYNNSKFY